MKYTRLALVLSLLPALAHAHPGHGADAGGIGSGMAHPFTGLDHLLAALSVGMLAVLWRRASLAVVFLVAGVLGGFAGAKIGAFIGLETVLAITVIVFGLALTFYKHVAQSAALFVVAAGAAMHGWAHGSEATGAMNIAGIFLGTAVIVSLGAVTAHFIRHAPRAITGLGAGIAIAAFAILAGVL